MTAPSIAPRPRQRAMPMHSIARAAGLVQLQPKDAAATFLPVCRMTRIDWPSLRVEELAVVAVQVEAPLARVVARVAQRLQIAESERVPVAAVGFGMVSDRSPRHHPTGQAFRAQRMLLKLQATSTSPALELIPAAPRAQLGITNDR